MRLAIATKAISAAQETLYGLPMHTRHPIMENLDRLVACRSCDLLLDRVIPPPGKVSRCPRCHHPLISNKRSVIDNTLAAAVSTAILMTAAVYFPFISLEEAGLSRDASVIDAIGAFAAGWSAPLTIAVAAFIVVIPVLRAVALIYALLPLRLGNAPAKGAARSFRLAMSLKPWAMAEIFIVGVAVALVKVTDLATVALGPSFWAFAALLLIVIFENTTLCEWTIWRLLDPKRR